MQLACVQRMRRFHFTIRFQINSEDSSSRKGCFPLISYMECRWTNGAVLRAQASGNATTDANTAITGGGVDGPLLLIPVPDAISTFTQLGCDGAH